MSLSLSEDFASRTITQCLLEGANRLIAAGISPSETRLETRLLLSHASGLSREALYLRPDDLLSPPATQRFQSLLTRREKREPLAYILGEREFYGLTFRVTPAVLIPRPETEFLVEAVLVGIEHRGLKENEIPRLADIGTGSGIIAIALAIQVPRAAVFATDISPEALLVAQENARRLGADERLVFAEGGLLNPIRNHAPFDVIVSNPPYIAPAEIETLEMEVRDFEPRIALGTHPDPLHFYRRLAAEAPPLLTPGGMLAVEVGQGQAAAVISLWRDAGLETVSTVRDYAGIERVVLGYHT